LKETPLSSVNVTKVRSLIESELTNQCPGKTLAIPLYLWCASRCCLRPL